MFEETNADINFLEQSTSATLIVTVPLMKDISHYMVPLNHPPPTLVHHLSHHLSNCPISFLLQLF